jgi:hypothetical protein
VAHEDNRSSSACDIIHLAKAAFLEGGISDREHFVNQEDLGLEMRRDGESQPQVHAARVVLHGRVDERSDLGKRNDSVELCQDLRALHAENRAAEQHVLAACQLRVETGAHFEQGADASVQVDLPDGGLGDAREDLQQGALPGPVGADQAQRRPTGHFERDVAQRPEKGGRSGCRPISLGKRPDPLRHRISQGAIALGSYAAAILFPDRNHANGGVAHG